MLPAASRRLAPDPAPPSPNAMHDTLWTWPIALGLPTTVGLAAALRGDGVWDAVSGVGLGVPVAGGAGPGRARRAGGPA